MSAFTSAWRSSHNARYFLCAFLSVTLLAGSAWAQAPTLWAISPSTLTPGTQVTLTGSGFGDTQGSGFVALWNSRSVPVISWSDSQIIVSVPTGTISGLAFVNQNRAWSNGISFTVPGAAAALGSAPLNFGGVPLGSSSTLMEVLTNNGGSSVRIFWAYMTGAGFTFSGLSTPLDLDPSESITFPVTFNPTGAGPLGGSLRIFSSGGFGPLSIPLSGEGQTTVQSGSLTITPAIVDFGSVTVGTNNSLTASLSAVGGSVVVSSASSTSPQFTLSGLSLPLTLSAGQSVPFTINFTPGTSGAAAAQIAFVSNATASPLVQSLSGTGAAVVAHSVDLSWNPDQSTVAGYNIYRGAQSGGPYTKMNSDLDGASTFVDSSVAEGQTYFYVVTAVDSTGNESQNSNEVQAVVPGS